MPRFTREEMQNIVWRMVDGPALDLSQFNLSAVAREALERIDQRLGNFLVSEPTPDGPPPREAVWQYTAPEGGAMIRSPDGQVFQLDPGQVFIGTIARGTRVNFPFPLPGRPGETGRRDALLTDVAHVVSSTDRSLPPSFFAATAPTTMRQQFEVWWNREISRVELENDPNAIEKAKHDMQSAFLAWRSERFVEHWWVMPSFANRWIADRDASIVEFKAAGWLADRVPVGTACIEVQMP